MVQIIHIIGTMCIYAHQHILVNNADLQSAALSCLGSHSHSSYAPRNSDPQSRFTHHCAILLLLLCKCPLILAHHPYSRPPDLLALSMPINLDCSPRLGHLCLTHTALPMAINSSQQPPATPALAPFTAQLMYFSPDPRYRYYSLPQTTSLLHQYNPLCPGCPAPNTQH